MAEITPYRRVWICSKCAVAFVFTSSYRTGDSWSKTTASADVSRQIAERKIRHKRLGCQEDRASFCFPSSGCPTPARLPFICPVCNSVYDAGHAESGTKLDCLKCGQRIQVPNPPQKKTVLGIFSPPVPSNSSPTPQAKPESTPKLENVSYAYECVATISGFVLGSFFCFLVAPPISAFFAGLFLGLAAFALAIYVGQSEKQWLDYKWWSVVALAALTVLSGTIKLLMAGDGAPVMFFSGFAGIVLGFPVGGLLCFVQRARLPADTLRLSAAVLAYAAVGVVSSFIFFVPTKGSSPGTSRATGGPVYATSKNPDARIHSTDAANAK